MRFTWWFNDIRAGKSPFLIGKQLGKSTCLSSMNWFIYSITMFNNQRVFNQSPLAIPAWVFRCPVQESAETVVQPIQMGMSPIRNGLKPSSTLWFHKIQMDVTSPPKKNFPIFFAPVVEGGSLAVTISHRETRKSMDICFKTVRFSHGFPMVFPWFSHGFTEEHVLLKTLAISNFHRKVSQRGGKIHFEAGSKWPLVIWFSGDVSSYLWICYWTWPISSGFTHEKWWFSI